MKYNFQSIHENLISSDLKNKLNFIILKVSETALNNKKNEIKNEKIIKWIILWNLLFNNF